MAATNPTAPVGAKSRDRVLPEPLHTATPAAILALPEPFRRDLYEQMAVRWWATLSEGERESWLDRAVADDRERSILAAYTYAGDVLEVRQQGLRRCVQHRDDLTGG
jgi:hypothetical protein